MYIIDKDNTTKNTKKIGEIDGYVMPSKTNKFVIKDTEVENITVVSKKLSHPLVYKKIKLKYDKLIELLAELIVSEDDSEGDTYQEILNRIEKFRLEIKNKYRAYLKKEELEQMAKGLKKIQKAAEEKYLVTENVLERQGKSR